MRKKIPIIIIIAAVLAFLIAGLYNELKIASYTLRSPKVERAIRIAFLSDLHSCNYSENAQPLVSAIERQRYIEQMCFFDHLCMFRLENEQKQPVTH